MQIFKLAIEIVKVLSGALITAIPLIVVIVRKAKAAKAAKNEAQRVAAINDIVAKAKELVQVAEEAYRETDTILKRNGAGSAGVFKKESVQAKLEAYSSQKGYDFTSDELSDVIENEVSFTNAVNVTK